MKDGILIAYYSWSGHTDKVARIIQQKTDGKLLRIKPVNEYPADYSRCVDQAKKEIKIGYLPEIEAVPDYFDSYRTIFIGSPIWWHTMAPPVLTFLMNAKLTGTQLVPFCTHGGGGKGRFVADILKQCSNSTVVDDLELYGSGGRNVEVDITYWLSGIGIA